MLQLEFIAHNIDELSEMATSLAEELRPGDVILLDGELGSGKSEFVRQCGRALGVIEKIDSPTYCFENVYETSAGFKLNHFDLYRLNESSELEEINFYEDGFEPVNAVSFVEWASLFEDEMPAYALRLHFEGSSCEPRKIIASGTSLRAVSLIESMENC